MTTLTSHSTLATPLDRALLRAAAGIDRFVTMRLERRTGALPSLIASQHETARTTAQALGAMGMLPR